MGEASTVLLAESAIVELCDPMLETLLGRDVLGVVLAEASAVAEAVGVGDAE